MKSIYRTLLLIIIAFASLDGLRDTFFYGNPISYTKELAVILLFLCLSYARVNKRQNLLTDSVYYYLFWILFLTSTFTMTFYFQGERLVRTEVLSFGGWSVWLKLAIQFLLIQSIIWLREEDYDAYKNTPKLYIYGVLFYCLFSLVFLTSGFAQNLTPRDWGGRYSIGYPTMDSYVLATAGLFLAYYFKYSIKKVLIGVIFFLLLLMQNTITGYLLIVFALFYLSISLPGKKKSLPIAFASALIITGIYLYFYVLESMGIFGALLIDKINGIFLGTQTSSSTIRQDQIAQLLSTISSEKIQSIFGLGGEAAFIVENNYIALYGLGGLFAIALFALIVIRTSYFGYKAKNRNLVLPAIGMYLIGGLSLISFYLFPFIFIFSFIIAESLQGRDQKGLMPAIH